MLSLKNAFLSMLECYRQVAGDYSIPDRPQLIWDIREILIKLYDMEAKLQDKERSDDNEKT